MAFRHDLHAGVFAALAAWLHFEKAQTGVAYHPLTVFQPPAVSDLHLQGHETVYFLDYTGPTGFPEAVAAALATGKVIVLDHHKTAADSLLGRTDLPANMVLDVDMSRSGATIARDWFRAAIPKDADLEAKFAFIEDADLWRWTLPDSRAFHIGLGALHLDYDANANPFIFDTLLELSSADIIAHGKKEMEEHDRQLTHAIETKHTVQLGGAAGLERGWACCYAVFCGENNVSSYVGTEPQLRSELGNRLAALSAAAGLAPMGVVAYHEAGIADETKVKISIRGVGDDVDTTAVTQAHGGGGHLKASSCIIPLSEYNVWRKQD